MKKLRITVEGKAYDVQVEMLDEGAGALPAGASVPVVSAAAATPAGPSAPGPAQEVAEGDVPSPLAGVVNAVEVVAGTSVKAGDLIITLEAMKMFTEIKAHGDGTVKAIYVKPGDSVDEGQPLYAFG